MTTNFEVLDKAERLELLAAELYGALAVRFGDDPAAARLFARLRDEEEQHAARVRLLAAQARRDRKFLGKIQADVRAMEDVAEELTTRIAEVRGGGWSADLARTKRLLLELEERCSRAHAEWLYNGAHPQLRTFFEKLAAQDAAHAELLRSG